MITLDTSQLQRWGGLLESEARQIRNRMVPAVSAQTSAVVSRAGAQAPRRTGALRASVRPLGRGLRRRVRAGSNRAFYGRFQEFGTRKMSANPFLVRQVNPTSQAEFERRVEKALEKGDIYR